MTTPEEIGPIRVGIGLIGREGRYLIRRRPEGTIMAGVWEFPGGKCEPGESPEEATRRECFEEIGLRVRIAGLRMVRRHRYPHAWVELHYFDGALEDQAAEPRSETGFQWVPAEALAGLNFPDANEPIVRELAAESGR